MSVILCTAGYDHTIRFWEALSGICSRTIQHPESQVNRLCITPDKKYLAAAGRHVVRLYDIKSSNPNAIMTFEGHTNNITGVAFHCEGKWMVTSSEDQTVRVWDTRSGQVQRNYHHSHPVNDVVIHPNQGELVSADRGGNIRIWDLGESKCTHQLIPAEDVSVSSVSVASDGSLLAAGNNKGDVYIWRMYQNQDSTTLQPCRHFNAHKDYLTRLLLSPDIKLLATCSSDHTVRIWRVDMNEENLEGGLGQKQNGNGTDNTQPTDQDPNASDASVTSSNDDGSEDDRSPVIQPLHPRPSQQQHAYRPAPGQQQQHQQQQHLQPPPQQQQQSNQLQLQPQPQYFQHHHQQLQQNVGNTSFGKISSEVANMRPLPCDTVLENHQRWVWDCAFSADSAYLVTVCSDHYARLWELSSATIIRQYNGHHRGAVCVALNDYSSPP